MSAKAIVTCAAITNGCVAWLVLDVPGDARNIDIDHLDSKVPEDACVAGMLATNGWHQDHGRWVCAAHPVRQEVPA